MKVGAIGRWPVLISSQIELKNPVKNRLRFTFYSVPATRANTNGVNSIDILLSRLIRPHRHFELLLHFTSFGNKTVNRRDLKCSAVEEQTTLRNLELFWPVCNGLWRMFWTDLVQRTISKKSKRVVWAFSGTLPPVFFYLVFLAPAPLLTSPSPFLFLFNSL